MGIPTTTQAAIREALVPIIEAIEPRYPEFQDVYWNSVDHADPSGTDLRAFRILTLPGVIDTDGIYGGDGLEMVCEMRIRVAYGGVNDNEAWDLITQDGLDLWVALHPSPAGAGQTIAGFISVDPLEIEFVDTDEDSSFLVVDFTTELHYKAAI